MHAFYKDCSDQLDFLSKGQCWAASFFAPGVAAGKALGLLNKLGFWLAKQTNTTSLALTRLLTARHATLQNRAAINFLLLALGHGCEDFDGMCCVNLSDHSQSIHSIIQALRDSMSKLQVLTA